MPHKRLVMTHVWDDENGKPGPETLVTVRFEDAGGRTKVTLEQTGFTSDADRDGHRKAGASVSICSPSILQRCAT